SFPSGHSMNSSVFFLSLTYFIFRNTRNRKLGIILTIFSGIIVVLIGLSRIYLGVHFPSDVLGGYAAGLLWFVAVLLFEKIIIFLRLFKKFEMGKKY
ncbi:MAG TPA: phosphatase PAP2 family protein, partial [Xanthomonadales bacterium]|nr:phosphatase PAP2 family protein [Xanthomonadales bacterium]